MEQETKKNGKVKGLVFGVIGIVLVIAGIVGFQKHENQRKNTQQYKYEMAVDQYKRGNYTESILMFKELEDKELAEQGSLQAFLFSILMSREGEQVVYGDYNGPLVWTVQSIETDGKVLVCNTPVPVDESLSTDLASWKESALREWLNGTFYEMAFDELEKNLLRHVLYESEEKMTFDLILLKDEESLETGVKEVYPMILVDSDTIVYTDETEETLLYREYGTTSERDYAKAMEYLIEGDDRMAYRYFSNVLLFSYRDKNEQMTKLEKKHPELKLHQAKAGDVVLWGEESWIVLEAKEDDYERLLLMSEHVLSYSQWAGFFDERVSWPNSTVRTYLQEELVQQVLPLERERDYIEFSRNVYPDDQSYIREDNTELTSGWDLIWLLSSNEVERYLSDPNTRITTDKEGNEAAWWLRSGMDGGIFAKYVDVDGEIKEKRVDESLGVRPVFWIKVKGH